MTGKTVENRGEHQVNRIILIFKRIGYSHELGMVALRYYLVFGAILGAMGHLRIWLQSLSPPHIFSKDFLQDFLIVKAVLSGVNPYLPIKKLADFFMGPLPIQWIFPHPSPHPPPVALFCLPFTLLSYKHAAIVWFLLELLCLSISVVLLLRLLGVQKRITLALVSALLILVWPPIDIELVVGQWTSLLLLLLIGAWRALRSKKDIQAGILLGSAIAVKLVPWPIMIFLMLRRNWRAGCAALTTIAVANVAASILIGIDQMTQYYLKVGKSVQQDYHAHIGNFSLCTIGSRLFSGTSLEISGGANTPPLFTAPTLAPFLSIAIPFAMLIIGFIFAFKTRTLDSSFGILICVMILVSPIAWYHYLILALIPLFIVIRNLSFLHWPSKETNIAMVVGITFLFSAREIIPLLVNHRIPDGLVPSVALLSLLPAVGLLGLLWLVWRSRPNEIVSPISRA